MASYKEIVKDIRERHGRVMKPCWIADVKEANGIQLRHGKRLTENGLRKHPCPDRYRLWIEESLRRFGMI